MEIEKLEDKYTIQKKDNTTWILYMGVLDNSTENSIRLKFTDVFANKFNIQGTCGCLTKNQTVIDESTVEVKVGYTKCEGAFAKTFTISNKNQNYELILKGTCQKKNT